jgi:hypothetical protein
MKEIWRTPVEWKALKWRGHAPRRVNSEHFLSYTEEQRPTLVSDELDGALIGRYLTGDSVDVDSLNSTGGLRRLFNISVSFTGRYCGESCVVLTSRVEKDEGKSGGASIVNGRRTRWSLVLHV